MAKAGRVIHLKQKLLEARIAKQHRLFATFFMVQHKLRGNARLTGPMGRNGRNPNSLLWGNPTLKVGTQQLVFDVALFKKRKVWCGPSLNFLTAVTTDFGAADATACYHFPLAG